MSSVIEAGDETLLHDYHRSGNQLAFAELNRRYIDFVYAAALRQSGNEAMAADVTQAVFLVLARKAKSIRAAALPSWLHRVTTYAVKNAQRAERRRRRHERAAAIQRPEVTMPSNDSESIGPLLDRAIASLSAKDQTVVIERFLCGRELADVATLVGASTTATQKRLERAVGRLRNYFDRHGIVIAATGIPWPTLHAAPALTIPSISASAPMSPLAGTLMKHLLWTKIGSITAALTAAVAVAAAVAVTSAIAAVHLEHAASVTSQPTAMDKPDAQPTPSSTTQQVGAGEVYLGGDVKRSGVYTLSSRLRTVGQLLIAAGVDLKPGDSFSVKHLRPLKAEEFAHLAVSQPAVTGAQQLLEPADVITVMIAPTALPDDAKAAPYSAIRWNGDEPEVFVGGTWYRWLAINDIPLSAVITAARDMDADGWKKRIGEDLVPVYREAANTLGRGPIGTDVRLTLQPINGGNVIVLPHVPMTEENRKAVYLRRVESEKQ